MMTARAGHGVALRRRGGRLRLGVALFLYAGISIATILAAFYNLAVNSKRQEA